MTKNIVNQGAHKDWMFDVVWLDDYIVVSGSRDTKMALWKLDELANNDNNISYIKPMIVKRCRTAQKVRALAFNKGDMEIAALSLNGFLHIWKADIFHQVPLPEDK